MQNLSHFPLKANSPLICFDSFKADISHFIDYHTGFSVELVKYQVR
jgi:hypothetical protein